MNVKVYDREEPHENGHALMLELAEQVEDHYTRPSPLATFRPDVFPKLLDHGIFWGLLLGALLGVLVAWLVHGGRVTPTGWEGLFSLVPFSFYAFFAFAGAALGLALGGVATLLAAPAPDLEAAETGAIDGIVVEEEARAMAVERQPPINIRR
jgi:hypothetical protein